MALPTRSLGDTGVRVSALGLGAVKIGRTEALKHPGCKTALPSDEEVQRLLATARDLGVNLLDTAPAYGVSEARLGALLTGQRDAWVISTKVGEEFTNGKSRYDFSTMAIRASVELSLRRLRADYVDVLLLHSDGSAEGELERDETIDALRQARDAGYARLVGASTKTLEGALRCVEALDVVMLTYNERHTASELAIAQAAKSGVGVLIKKALDSGWIAHDATAQNPSPCGDHGATAAALRFAMAPADVSSVVVGTTSPDHLRQNAQAITNPGAHAT